MPDNHRGNTSKETPPSTVVKTEVGGISDITLGTTSEGTDQLPGVRNLPQQGSTPESLLLPQLDDDDEVDCVDDFSLHHNFPSPHTSKENNLLTTRNNKNENSGSSPTPDEKANIGTQNGVSILRNEKFMSNINELDFSERMSESNKLSVGNDTRESKYRGQKRDSNKLEDISHTRHNSRCDGDYRQTEIFKRARSSPNHTSYAGSRHHQSTIYSGRREYASQNRSNSRNHNTVHRQDSIHRTSGKKEKEINQDTNQNPKHFMSQDVQEKKKNYRPSPIGERQQRLHFDSPVAEKYRSQPERSSPCYPPIIQKLSPGSLFNEGHDDNSISPIVSKHSEKTINSIDSQNMLLFENSFGDSIGEPDLANFPLDGTAFNTFNVSPNRSASFCADRILSADSHRMNQSGEKVNRSQSNCRSSERMNTKEVAPSRDSPSISIMMLSDSSPNSLKEEGSSGLTIEDSPSDSIRAYNHGTSNRKYNDVISSRCQKRNSKGDKMGNDNHSSERDSERRQKYHSHPKTVSPPERPTPKKIIPQFYFHLRRYRRAFSTFTFLLPGMKISSSEFDKIMSGRKIASSHEKLIELTPADITTARDRLSSSVHLFGGSVGQLTRKSQNKSNRSSIFRRHNELDMSSHQRFKTPGQLDYERKLPLRYFENDNRISWEVEENPPVEIVTDEEDNDLNNFDRCSTVRVERNLNHGEKLSSSDFNIRTSHSQIVSGSGKNRDNSYMDTVKSSFRAESPTPTNSMAIVTKCGEAPKMKYRCKLCGQPKQNHTCPYEQSLQRSIGTMAFGSLNAHNAHEPGSLSAPLSEMNNFPLNEDEEVQLGLPISTKSVPDEKKESMSSATKMKVNDESHKDTRQCRVAASTVSVSSNSEVLSPVSSSLKGLKNNKTNQSVDQSKRYFWMKLTEEKRRIAAYSKQKRSASNDLSKDKLVQPKMELRPEQYRTITPLNNSQLEQSYEYPTLPLTYRQRKRLSDSLFTLSKEVLGLTDECAVILRQARETNMWDLAIAELLTQVLVITHCPENDNKLDGLSKYLMTFGVSC